MKSLVSYIGGVGAFAAFFISLVSEAQVCVVLRTSDTHTHYRNAEKYIRFISHKCQEYKLRFGADTICIVENAGDISGVSRDAYFDFGALMLEMYSSLASVVDANGNPQYRVILNEGNHDGIDYAGSEEEANLGLPPNGLMLREKRQYIRALQEKRVTTSPQGFLAANISTTSEGQGIYLPHFDIPLNNQRILRVIGTVLPNLIELSSYDLNSPLQVFDFGATDKNLFPDIASTLKAEIRKAVLLLKHDPNASNGVFLIFESHERYDFLEDEIKKVLEYFEELASDVQEKIHILYAGAAHDHRRALRFIQVGNLPQIPLVDSGDQLEVTELAFDLEQPYAPPITIEHHRVAVKEIPEIFPLFSEERAVIEKIRQALSRLSPVMDRQLALLTQPLPADKMILKDAQRPTAFGAAMANTLVEAAAQYLHDHPELSKGTDIFSFYNTTSIRITTDENRGLLPGPFVFGHIVDIAPFNSLLEMFLLTGEEIQKFYNDIRVFKRAKKKIWSPQLPSHLGVSSDAKELLVYEHKFLTDKGKVTFIQGDGEGEPLDPKAQYWLALDEFTIRRLTGLLGWEKIFKEAPHAVLGRVHEVLTRHLPRQVSEHPCLEVLSGKRVGHVVRYVR